MKKVFFTKVLSLFSFRNVTFLVILILFSVSSYYLWNNKVQLESQVNSLNSSYQQLQKNYQQSLDQDQIYQLEKIKLEESKRQVEEEYEKLKSDASKEKLAKIEEIFQLYQSAISKIDRNNKVKVDNTEVTGQLNDWGQKFLKQDFGSLKETITQANTNLDKKYQEYLASLPPPEPPKPAPAPAAGYSYQSVSTSRGNYNVHLIKMSLSEVRVKTITANESDCTNNCPAKPLADYVKENGAYAGINGTYFCPPDYSACSGKTNSYDFTIFNSNLGKWINAHNLNWNSPGLATFNGSEAHFYAKTTDYTGNTVTAAISNYFGLLSNNNVVVSESVLTSAQKVKGTRGALGTDGTNVYLATISNATVIDAAYVMQALGAKDALNLDGGGSSAMYIGGSYKVGPGRLLPNAIVLVK
jgi:uncharacterized protein involved in tolerance to divalent cations